MPMDRIWRSSTPLLSGTSSDRSRSRWRRRYTIKKHMESTVPAVTPRMAPAAPASSPRPNWMRYHAQGRPMPTLHRASKI